MESVLLNIALCSDQSFNSSTLGICFQLHETSAISRCY